MIQIYHVKRGEIMIVALDFYYIPDYCYNDDWVYSKNLRQLINQ